MSTNCYLLEYQVHQTPQGVSLCPSFKHQKLQSRFQGAEIVTSWHFVQLAYMLDYSQNGR